MARMIPPLVSKETLSPGEKLLFARFRNEPVSSTWVVLHSLGIATHPVRQMGEIDFVVLVPGEGVLCLEVKAGQVARANGVWTYGRGPEAVRSTVGPFRQASDAMHALRRHIVRQDPAMSRLLFWSGAIFTMVDFDEASPEWHSWQCVGRSQLARFPLTECCVRILESAHSYIRDVPSCRWYDDRLSRPTEEHVREIAEMLRPDFEYHVSVGTVNKATELAIHHYTKEQFSALDLLQENPRALFKGPAGTGKTFLAVEAAKRYALQGQRTLLVCFNRFLGEWLKEEVTSLGTDHRELIVAGTYHQFLLQLSGCKPPQDPDHSFWAQSLPSLIVDKILEGAIRAPQFDVLILDEAQDLATDQHLDVLDLLIEGGLAGGRWAMFGDFERQSIYRQSTEQPFPSGSELLKSRHLSFVPFPLRVNCRNTVGIVAALEMATGLEPGYSRVLDDSPGYDVEVEFYADTESQSKLLHKWCKALLERHGPDHIVVLSTRQDSLSCACRSTSEHASVTLHPLRDLFRGHSSICYSTIHAFKGLESPAIVLTDIEDLDTEATRALLYVGMSRARLTLVLLMSAQCKSTWNGLLRKGLLKGSSGRCFSGGNA